MRNELQGLEFMFCKSCEMRFVFTFPRGKQTQISSLYAMHSKYARVCNAACAWVHVHITWQPYIRERERKGGRQQNCKASSHMAIFAMTPRLIDRTADIRYGLVQTKVEQDSMFLIFS